MTAQFKNKVAPITFAESITGIVVTPDAPNNLLSDWGSRYGVSAQRVGTTKKCMSTKPTKKQLQRSKQYQRRSQ